MKHLFVWTEPDDFTEVMWETLIALAIAAAISVGMISLSVHLNETRNVRASAVGTAQAAAAHAVQHRQDCRFAIQLTSNDRA